MKILKFIPVFILTILLMTACFPESSSDYEVLINDTTASIEFHIIFEEAIAESNVQGLLKDCLEDGKAEDVCKKEYVENFSKEEGALIFELNGETLEDVTPSCTYLTDQGKTKCRALVLKSKGVPYNSIIRFAFGTGAKNEKKYYYTPELSIEDAYCDEFPEDEGCPGVVDTCTEDNTLPECDQDNDKIINSEDDCPEVPEVYGPDGVEPEDDVLDGCPNSEKDEVLPMNDGGTCSLVAVNGGGMGILFLAFSLIPFVIRRKF